MRKPVERDDDIDGILEALAPFMMGVRQLHRLVRQSRDRADGAKRERDYEREQRNKEKAERDRLREWADQALEALIWASGSPSFQEDGEAREGWLKLGRPMIESGLALLAEAEPRAEKEDTNG